MSDDTRARQAVGHDVVARLRRWAEFCDHGVAPLLPEAAAAIEARDAEIARLEAEVASLRITLGGRTFSATTPEPIGCPLPGMCVQVAEIARMREALARIVALGNRVDMSGQCAIAVAIISARAALAPPPASDAPAPAGWDEGTCNR